jgi:hypothetical protein
MTEPVVITDENFALYFRDVVKNKKQDGDMTVSYRSVMQLPDCQLKRDVIRLLAEVHGGAAMAVEALTRYAAASKSDAIRLCGEMSTDLLSGLSVEKAYNKVYKYHVVLFFYVKPEYFPKAWLEEKNTAWSIVPDETNKLDDI